ncbi:homeobox protein Hox-C9 isoform X1 [Podarcis lilfordi]|uniref:Gypsy retrotransposon integrase-like protein 1 n=1 Tax=Podarcis lilfordi TaxID=74358 RepID=A0AA35NV85_9SAUR|nr:homeobox protein Hox-C9 isoform X1 [Podarcis lilfordi]
MSAQQYEEEEDYGPRSGPSCLNGEKEPQLLEGQAPSYHPAPRYSHDQELRDVGLRCATREFSIWDLDFRLFPAYKPPMDVLYYFTLFELSCRELGVPPRLYMIILRALVSGELADLMGQVSLSYAMDYEHYKHLALQRYGQRAESYRQAFRKVDKAASAESLTLVAAKMAQNFELWMSAADVTTFEGLKQLMLKEQFNRLLPAELGLLYRQFWPKKIKDKDVVLQLVVPGSRQPKILDLAHHDGLAGHLGVQKTLERISRYFYWPDVHQSVNNFVRSCVVCQKIGNDKDSMPNTLQSVPLESNVLEKWGIDLVGPLQKTRAGKQYVCVIIDYASRYVWATSLPNTSAQNLAKALVLAFGSLGIPKVLVSDLGTNVLAELTQKVLQLAKVHHHTSIAYQHQGNGLIKRVQKTLVQMLRKCGLAHGSSWDQDLPLVVSAYNDAYQRSLGFASNQLIFGRLLNTPLSMLRREWEGSEEEIKVPSVSEYFANLRQTLSDIWQLAKENLEGARLEQKRCYDLKAVAKSFEVGDQVLVWKPTRPHKLVVKWHGPGIVKAKLSSVRYLVECQELHDGSREYHANSLKRYLESELSVLSISGGREEVPTAPKDLLEE